MKKFLLSFSTFIFPFLLLLVAIELYVLSYPSTFNRKAKYLHANAGTAEMLVLCSSHNQNALNPEFLKLKTINLANASQDVQIDSAMFFKYIPEMKALKAGILELDYFTLEEKNDAENFRLPAEGLVDRLAADDRIPLSRADLDAIIGDPLAFVGDARRQVATFAATVGKLVTEHPDAASYQPDRLL